VPTPKAFGHRPEEQEERNALSKGQGAETMQRALAKQAGVYGANAKVFRPNGLDPPRQCAFLARWNVNSVRSQA